jgi:hypothetical protein
MQLIVHGSDEDLRAIQATLNGSGNFAAVLTDLEARVSAIEKDLNPQVEVTQGPIPFPYDWSAKR